MSLGEAVAGGARVLGCDALAADSARGTFELVRTLTLLASRLDHTVALSLLRPAAPVLQLVDHVIVIGDGGGVLFQGPPASTKAHFRDVPDWLSADFGGRAEALAAAFRATDLHARAVDALERPSAHAVGAWPEALTLTFPEAPGFYLYWCARRRCFEVVKSRDYVRARVLQALALGIVTGLVFRDLKESDAASRVGLLFTVLFCVWGGVL